MAAARDAFFAGRLAGVPLSDVVVLDESYATTKFTRLRGRSRRGVRLRVSRAWARRVKQVRDEPPKKNGGRSAKLGAAARATLAAWVDAKPDATLEELRGRVSRELGIAVSTGCLWNTLRRMKLTFKKSR